VRVGLAAAIMVTGAAGVTVAWRMVVGGRASIWAAMSAAVGLAGVASVATGLVSLSPHVGVGRSLIAGSAAGMGLYVATIAFVALARRWNAFARHVEAIYDQRRGLSLPAALLLAAVVVGQGEELFWRGLFQGRLSEVIGPVAAALVTWGTYGMVNVASGSLPIVAAALVSGAVWGGLALWTGGVLASMACHGLWTALMVALPPDGRRR
jgi:membrane protease YdiL (CAAX protease family)